MSKKHYYLVSGEVYFVPKDAETTEDMGSSKLNTTIMTEEPVVTARNLGRATQGLQVLLKQRAGPGADLRIVDVFISNLSYLGHMTEAEFTAGTETLDTVAEPAA
jgi:hypothetical protein